MIAHHCFQVVSANEDYPEYNWYEIVNFNIPPKAKFDGVRILFCKRGNHLAVYH